MLAITLWDEHIVPLNCHNKNKSAKEIPNSHCVLLKFLSKLQEAEHMHMCKNCQVIIMS